VLNLERDGQVLVATLDDGKANALSHALIDALRGAVAEAEADPEVRALAIVGRPGRFSAGFDLSVIQSGDPDAVARLIADGGDLVRTVYSAGVPVVAACTGHALAAGALLLLACDRRIGADAEVKIGLNEVAIGLALPRWAVAIAAARLAPTHLQASVATGQLYNGKGAVTAGYLDRVVEPDQVVEAAVREAAELAATLDLTSYALTIKALRRGTIEQMV
jgi:enoyl-CoA hydratase